MYKCDECGKEFDSARKLGGHKSSHKRGESYRKKRETEKSKKKRENKNKSKQCQYCEKEFENGWQLGGHVTMCRQNPNYAKNVEKMSNSLKGKKHSNETKEILSEKRSIYLEEEGKGGFRNIKWYNVHNLKGERFIVRGTWELKMAKWLNSKVIIGFVKYILNMKLME
jgi:DNA-directed RNA polymerase subunit RPC12/RpoP